MPRTALSEVPNRHLLYSIIESHGDRPTRSVESAQLLIDADDLLDDPLPDAREDERACREILRKIWRWNLRSNTRKHVAPTPGRAPADLWEQLCALFDKERAAELDLVAGASVAGRGDRNG